MPICHNLKLCFIHVPKTAGTSIERAFGWHGEKNLIGSLSPKYNVCPQHLYWKELEREFPQINEYTKFSIVRNPFDRLVSEYCYAQQYKCRPSSFIKGLKFDEFIENFLKLNKEERCFIFDRHLELQTKFIEGCEDLHLFKYEDLNSCFSFLTQIKEDLLIKHENQSLRKTWQSYYSEKSKCQVYDFYKADFDKLGYSF